MGRVFKIGGGIIIALLLAVCFSWLYSVPNKEQRGIWINPTNGNILEFGRLKANLYTQTSLNCAFDSAFPAHMALVKAMENAWIEVEGDTLRLMLETSLDAAEYKRADALPDACNTPTISTPHTVFETMWAAMNENYAFFDLYGIDWAARRSQSPAKGAEMSDEALIETLSAALDGIDDGHVHLVTGDLDIHSPRQAPSWMAERTYKRSELNDIARRNIGIELIKSPDAPLNMAYVPTGLDIF